MKNILVTGGNKGIGFAVCQRLLKEYPDVMVFLGSRDADRGRAAIRQLLAEQMNPSCKDRIELVLLDVCDEESVQRAATQFEDDTLFGLVNNAGTAHNDTLHEILAVNYWGVRTVVDAFLPKMVRQGGRIVMVSSVVGPTYVSKLKDTDEIKTKLSQPWLISSEQMLDDMARSTKIKWKERDKGFNGYGWSKALLNCYTYLLSRKHPQLIINAVTPGFVKTDLTKASAKATKSPWEGAGPILFLLFDADIAALPSSKQGRYYSSDSKRSPLDKFRLDGDPEYDGPDEAQD